MVYRVYKIVFRSGELYIGMTGRLFSERLEEHRLDANNERLCVALMHEPNPEMRLLGRPLKSLVIAKKNEEAYIRAAWISYGDKLLNKHIPEKK